jgi:uncharacterized protein (DUF58 family)
VNPIRPAVPRPETPKQARWMLTGAMRRAVWFSATAMLLGVAQARPDLLLLGVPIAVATAISLWRRPSALPVVGFDVETSTAAEGGHVNGRVALENVGDVDYDLVIARAAPDRWLPLDRLAHPFVGRLPAGTAIDVEFDAIAARWGRRRAGPIYAHAVAADGLMLTQMVTAYGHDIRVYPNSDAFAAHAVIASAAGMVGFHRSRRPGDGGELASVRAFGPGDRLRRIDWRVSLRTRELHVSSTLSDRDAEIVLILDVTHEAGRSGGFDGFHSALDITVRAAAGIADYYLHRGDRVSMIEHGHAGRRLRSATGHRHFLTALEWLLDVRPVLSGRDLFPVDAAGTAIRPNALLICLTPILDEDAVKMLARFARSGRTVVTVDTMPAQLLTSLSSLHAGRFSENGPYAAADSPSGPVAARLWRFDRANTIAELREHGVPVVPWAGAGSLDHVLQQVARVNQAPRLIR